MGKKIKLFGREEVAAILGIHPKTLDRHILRSGFPAPRLVAGRQVWTREDIDVGIEYGERFSQAGAEGEDVPGEDDEPEKNASKKKSG